MKKGCKSGVKKKRGYAAGGMITEAAQSTMAPSKSRKRKPKKSFRK